MSTCYHYSSETGEFITSGALNPSPLEPGQYLLPSHATLLPPPETDLDSVACWNGSSWVIQKDLRGKHYWEKETQTRHTITSLNEYPQDSWTDMEPGDPSALWNGKSWEIPLSILKDRKISQIRNQVDLLLREIQKNFSDTEFLSWSKQEAGARALKEDIESQSPDAEFVRSIASARGISLEEQIERIMNHIVPSTSILAQMLGEQQRREDLVNAVTSQDELDALDLGLIEF